MKKNRIKSHSFSHGKKTVNSFRKVDSNQTSHTGVDQFTCEKNNLRLRFNRCINTLKEFAKFNFSIIDNQYFQANIIPMDI